MNVFNNGEYGRDEWVDDVVVHWLLSDGYNPEDTFTTVRNSNLTQSVNALDYLSLIRVQIKIQSVPVRFLLIFSPSKY